MIICNSIFEYLFMKITFGYWGNIKGRGQVSRYLLAYTGANFQEKQYAKQEDWFQGDKISMGLHLAFIIKFLQMLPLERSEELASAWCNNSSKEASSYPSMRAKFPE